MENIFKAVCEDGVFYDGSVIVKSQKVVEITPPDSGRVIYALKGCHFFPVTVKPELWGKVRPEQAAEETRLYLEKKERLHVLFMHYRTALNAVKADGFTIFPFYESKDREKDGRFPDGYYWRKFGLVADDQPDYIFVINAEREEFVIDKILDRFFAAMSIKKCWDVSEEDEERFLSYERTSFEDVEPEEVFRKVLDKRVTDSEICYLMSLCREQFLKPHEAVYKAVNYSVYSEHSVNAHVDIICPVCEQKISSAPGVKYGFAVCPVCSHMISMVPLQEKDVPGIYHIVKDMAYFSAEDKKEILPLQKGGEFSGSYRAKKYMYDHPELILDGYSIQKKLA